MNSETLSVGPNFVEREKERKREREGEREREKDDTPKLLALSTTVWRSQSSQMTGITVARTFDRAITRN